MSLSYRFSILLKACSFKLVYLLASLIPLLFGSVAYGLAPFNILYHDSSNRYVYVSDFLGNHVMDFSHAGYQGGDAPVPSLDTLPIFPVPNQNDPACSNTNDYTACIQNAINAAGQNYANTKTLSVVQIAAGTYPLVVPVNPGAYLLNIPTSGVILAGAGSANTILSVTGRAPIPNGIDVAVISAGGNNPNTAYWGAVGVSTALIANKFVPAGSTEFRIQSAANNGYTPAVGDNIIIDVPTQNYWSSFTNFGGIGAGATLPPNTTAAWWGVGTIGPINSTYNMKYSTKGLNDIRYNRTVTSVVNLGNNTYGVSVDAPIFAAINNGNTSPVNLAMDATPYVYPFNAATSGYQNNIGVQNLSINIGFYSGTADYNVLQEYATIGISFNQANDVWIDDVIVSGYRSNGIVTSSVNQATISNSKVINQNTYFTNAPSFDGGFGFSMYTASSNILLTQCSAIMPSHGYAAFTPSTSGIVVLNSSSTNNYLESGGHKNWPQGILFDHLSINNDIGRWASAAFNNSFIAGTSHGWTAANSVMWGLNLDQSGIAVVQQPPQGQNYFLSYTRNQPSGAIVTGQGLCNGTPCTQPSGNPGYFEMNTALDNSVLPSLYQSQLTERQAAGTIPPSAPSSLQVTFALNKATLKWDTLLGSGQGLQNIVIERSNDGGNTFTQIDTVLPDATTYVDSKVGVSINSLYRIYSQKTQGNARSAYSNLAPIVARYVKLVPYTSSTTLNGGSINLNDFKVYSKSGSAISPKAVYVYNNSKNSYTKTSLPATCSRNSIGCAFDSSLLTYYAGSASPWITATPSTNQQNLYIDLTGTNSVLSLSKITLTFGNATSSTDPFPPEYYIYVSTDGVNWTQVYNTIFGIRGLNTITFN